MSFFQQEMNRIKNNCHSNKGQLNTVILTRNFINNHFQKELNLELLSQLQFTSKYHLLRLFKQYYGLTIRQYLIDVRIEKSKEFLCDGMSVTETCFAVGYKSPSSFITLFKTKTGITPSGFQKQQFSTSKSHTDL